MILELLKDGYSVELDGLGDFIFRQGAKASKIRKNVLPIG